MTTPSPRAGQPAQTTPDSSRNLLLDEVLRVQCAYILTASTPRRLSPEEVLRWEPRQGPLWVHLENVQAYPESLKEHHAIDSAVLQSLQGEARRPRVEVVNQDDLVIVFRTINVDATPTADLSQTTRVWLSPMRAITMVKSHVDAFMDCAHQIESSRGPKTIPEFLVRLMDNVVKRAELAILQVDADLTDIELEEERGVALQADRPRAIRRQAMQLRRSMTPYREVLVQLNHLRLQWLRDQIKDTWHPMVEDVAQVVEEVDGILDRARLVQESISDRLARELNQRVYVLTLISGIMLPLTFLTGLLGVNLGGIPGANRPAGRCPAGRWRRRAFPRPRRWSGRSSSGRLGPQGLPGSGGCGAAADGRPPDRAGSRTGRRTAS
jgi:zinc transporter